jgi:hypothetical protein
MHANLNIYSKPVRLAAPLKYMKLQCHVDVCMLVRQAAPYALENAFAFKLLEVLLINGMSNSSTGPIIDRSSLGG